MIRSEVLVLELVLGVFGALVLHVYFGALRTRWPLSYFSVGDLTAYRVSRSPFRYILFRLVPVVLASLLVATLATRLDGDGGLAVLSLAAVHSLATSGRGLWTLVSRKNVFARASQILIHLVIGVGVFAAALAGNLMASINVLRKTVPAPDDVATALWTAIFAATAGVFILRSTQHDSLDPGQLIGEVRSKLPAGLWEMTEEIASAEGADPHLARAVLLAEALQRPSWVRALERLKGLIVKSGTYGVMQVWASEPISDEESVRRAVRERLSGSAERMAGGEIAPLKALLRDFNPSSDFVELGQAFYWTLRPSDAFEADEWDEDEDEDDLGNESVWELLSSYSRFVVAGAAGGLTVLAALSLRSVLRGGVGGR